MSSDRRKQGYSLPSDVLEEMHAAAEWHEASLSWVAQQAWKIAREEIAKMPPSPSWAAKQRELEQQAPALTQQAPALTQQAAEPSQSSSKPQPAEPQRPPAPPRPAPSQSSPDSEPQRQPARQAVTLTPWEMERLHDSHHAQSGEPLDHQAREFYPWDNDGPTI